MMLAATGAATDHFIHRAELVAATVWRRVNSAKTRLVSIEPNIPSRSISCSELIVRNSLAIGCLPFAIRHSFLYA